MASGGWESQVEQLRVPAFSLAMQMLRNHADAADAVQDCLHQLVRKPGRFDPARGELRAWFLKVVRNRCLDLIRSRSRRDTRPLDSAEQATAGGESPAEMAEKRELLDVLKQQLMSMPEPQRELILLRDYHNLGYAEIAEVLSIPVGTVMSRLHRARQELRRRMQDYR